MWEDILKRRTPRQVAESLDGDDFNDFVGDELDYVVAEIKNKYYPYYTDERKQRFDARVSKVGTYINRFEYIKALRILRRIKGMVEQFNLPDLDYLIQVVEIKGNER